MPTIATVAAAFAGAFAGAALLYQYAARLLITYNITESSVDVWMLSLFRISLDIRSISEIRETSFLESTYTGWGNHLGLCTLRIPNRILGRPVVIRRGSGFFRCVVLTPSHPRAFVALVEEKRARLQQESRTGLSGILCVWR